MAIIVSAAASTACKVTVRCGDGQRYDSWTEQCVPERPAGRVPNAPYVPRDSYDPYAPTPRPTSGACDHVATPSQVMMDTAHSWSPGAWEHGWGWASVAIMAAEYWYGSLPVMECDLASERTGMIDAGGFPLCCDGDYAATSACYGSATGGEMEWALDGLGLYGRRTGPVSERDLMVEIAEGRPVIVLYGYAGSEAMIMDGYVTYASGEALFYGLNPTVEEYLTYSRQDLLAAGWETTFVALSPYGDACSR